MKPERDSEVQRAFGYGFFSTRRLMGHPSISHDWWRRRLALADRSTSIILSRKRSARDNASFLFTCNSFNDHTSILGVKWPIRSKQMLQAANTKLSGLTSLA